MNFKQLTDQFNESSLGTDAFKNLYRSAFDLMKEDANNASLYFVIGTAARAFVMRYEDQGLSSEFVDEAKATMRRMNEKILSALASDPAGRLRLLSEVAMDYEWNVTAF
jgi:hypothetical protein